jgi:Beta protein
MSVSKTYVPVLKGKRAEFPALEGLKSKKNIAPLIEVVPGQPNDFIAKRMTKAWDKNQAYFVDAIYLDDEDMEEDDAASHPIRTCFTEIARKSQLAIPVTGTGRSPAYHHAVKSIVKEQKNGFAIRLVIEDFEDDDDLLESLNALVDLIGSSRKRIDLIVDLDTVAHMRSAQVTNLWRVSLAAIPDIEEWRTLTAVAGGFPLGLGPLSKNAWNEIPRVDWLGWSALIAHPRSLTRVPDYGDYATANPNLPPSTRATILGQMRYTTPTKFLIYKGADVLKHPKKYKQFNEICKLMIARPEYCGKTFSLGDRMIYEKATTDDSPGNTQTWRTIFVNHHIEMVKDQLASLP